MSLPKEIGSHHTMWFTVGAHRQVAVRYAVDNDEVDLARRIAQLGGAAIFLRFVTSERGFVAG